MSSLPAASAAAQEWIERGAAFLATGAPADAEPCFREALRRDERSALAWFNLAVCLRLTGFGSEAVDAYRHAIEEQPTFSLAYEQLGKHLYREGRGDDAAAVYAAWSRIEPSSPVAAHMFAATGGAPMPARASDGFVSSVFDRAAVDYDSALVNLGFQAPQLLADCAAQFLGPASGSLDVIDVGCGTGLCGPLIRPWARRLVGVDLSQGMLKQARDRNVYDELHAAELTAFLESSPATFDLLIAADVFCYFGDLAAALAAARTSLRLAGCLLFSLEHLQEPGGAETFALLEHGRYAHGQVYIERLLSTMNMNSSVTRTHMLRFERGAPVAGLIISGTLGAGSQ